ncbi:MAG TPA: ABC-F family ATP-binding cassette domain-containing protein [Stellaceae bacterium]|nr:ABC-F family ATP-binding cassette domain-containing protein [Stellaceae bacterium]
MLTITNLTYRIAGRTLLENTSAKIPAGHRVGIVGRNGAGKSTLFGLIMGELQPDGGSLDRRRGTSLGIVAQEAPGGEFTPLDVVLAADLERAALLDEAETATDPDRVGEIHMRLLDIDAHAAPARAAGILAGLGFDDAMQGRPMSSYSGGWRMRVALAAVLFTEPDLLLLDEPTNHLDLEATVWLENYLKSYPHTVLVVSHDRALLNSSVSHILHLDHRKLTLYAGGYDSFERLRAERLAQTKAQAAKQEAQRQHMQAFVDRFRAQATKARQAQSRLKALARLGPAISIENDPTMRFEFPDPPELAPPLLSMDGVDVGYEAGRPILRNLDLRLDPDDRIAFLGSNGNGKSTLAKLIAGRLQPQSGEQHRSGKLRCGFFAQHQIEDMHADWTPYEHMAELMPTARPEQVRARLGRFGFGQDKAFVKVKDLSGGEKARLNFALITHDAPPLLILDEPTNHLDIDSRAALAEAINDFKGAVILISHDWHLLELTADRLWLVANGRVTPFEGDLEDYRRLMLGERGGKARQNDGNGGKNNRQGKQSNGRPKSLEPLRRSAQTAEADLARLTAELGRLDGELADGRLATPRRVELTRRRVELERRVAAAEEQWLEAAAALEQASAA